MGERRCHVNAADLLASHVYALLAGVIWHRERWTAGKGGAYGKQRKATATANRSKRQRQVTELGSSAGKQVSNVQGQATSGLDQVHSHRQILDHVNGMPHAHPATILPN